MTLVRRIDDLGRIVLPKDVRSAAGIVEGEALNIDVEDRKIVISKRNIKMCIYCNRVIPLVRDSFYDEINEKDNVLCDKCLNVLKEYRKYDVIKDEEY